MNDGYTIQEISKLIGLSIHTLRYYEKIGLIKPVRRNHSGYRCYTERDIAWIRFVNRLRTTGMPVKEMVSFAVYHGQGDRTIPERREMLQLHRQQVEKAIIELTSNLVAIDEKIAFYLAKESN